MVSWSPGNIGEEERRGEERKREERRGKELLKANFCTFREEGRKSRWKRRRRTTEEK